MTLSIVSPVYNSVNTIYTLIDEIEKSVSVFIKDFEIILVDDGSIDESWNEIEKISAQNSFVKGIKLSRNFGQHYAISAGLEHVKGDWIVVMDCDLQDNPTEIPRLFKKAQEGYAIVTAQRINRKDNFFKRWSSKLFWKTLSYLTGTSIDHTVANFGIYRKDVIANLNLMKETIRFFPTMVLWVGFKSTSIKTEHSNRHDGKTTYSYYKMFRLAIDVILANSDKPIRIVIRIGFLISFFSFFLGIYYLFLRISNQIIMPGYTSLIISIWFLGGLTILILGILGLYLGKTFEGVKGRPNYIIEKKTN